LQARRIKDLIKKYSLDNKDPLLREYMHLHGGSTDSLAKAIDELDGAADVADLQKRMASVTAETVKELRDRLGAALYDELAKEMPPSVIASLEQKVGKDLLEELSKDLSPKTLAALSDLTGPEIKALMNEFGAPALNALGPAVKGKGLEDLRKLDMFKFDPAKDSLLKAGQGKAVQSMPPLQGKSLAEVETALNNGGFTKTASERGMDIWTHADGSVVRIKLGPEALRGPRTIEHFVKEISRTPGSFQQADIFAKVADTGAVVPAGTKFAQESLKQWFKKRAGRDPTPAELDLLMKIWGDAGHVQITP
jgi:hypothetical protein